MNKITNRKMTIKTLKTALVMLIVTSGLMSITGCQKEARVYQIPKESYEADTVLQKHIMEVSWIAPVHWTKRPADGLRKGSYQIGDSADGRNIDVSVISFPGSAGGVFQNINRWRNQIGLAPLQPAEFSAALAAHSSIQTRALSTDHHEMELTVVILENPDTQEGVLGGILPLGAETWFFKMTGPLPNVKARIAEFDQFLDTIIVSDDHHGTPEKKEKAHDHAKSEKKSEKKSDNTYGGAYP